MSEIVETSEPDTTAAETPAAASPVAADPAASPAPDEPDPQDLAQEEKSTPQEPDVFNDTPARSGEEENFDQKSKKFFLEQAAGDLTIGNGGGPINPESRAERKEKREEDFADRMERVERLMQQMDHARKWDGETHEFAGVKATGREFYEMREFLKSETGRKKVIEQLQQQGMSKDQAERATKKAEELTDYIDRMRRGETLSDDEKKRMDELQRDKDTRAGMAATQVVVKNEGLTVKSEAGLTKDTREAMTSLSTVTIKQEQPLPGESNKAFFPGAVDMKSAFAMAHGPAANEDTYAQKPGVSKAPSVETEPATQVATVDTTHIPAKTRFGLTV